MSENLYNFLLLSNTRKLMKIDLVFFSLVKPEYEIFNIKKEIREKKGT
jgi:hypothetical protein